MAWEWSHTIEAYDNARANVDDLPKRRLLEILREWAYDDREKSGRLRTRAGAKRPAGFRLPKGIRKLTRGYLAELVWQRAEEHRTCTNGGHEAYVCPDGCHTVSFDRAREGGSDASEEY